MKLSQLAVGVGVAVGSVTIAFGGPLDDRARNAGYTEPQVGAANAIQPACININAPGVANTPDRIDFRDECNRMVRTARNLNNGNTASQPDLGANSTDATLANALQQAAGEEMAGKSKLAIETVGKSAGNAIRGRLSAVRAGSKGLAFNGIDVGGKRTLTAQSVFGKAQRGGAAGADDSVGGRLGTFVNFAYNQGDKSATSREDGFDFDSWSVMGGADYRFSDKFVAGVSLGYVQNNSDVENNQGKIDADSIGGALYGSFYLDKFYLDGHVSYYKHDYDSERHIVYPGIDRVAKGSTNGEQLALSFGGGYDFALGGLTLTPYGRVEYIDLSIDGFDEEGARGLNLHVDSQSAKSLQGIIGGRGSYSISTGFGVLIPQVGVELIHEFDNDSRNITARFVVDPQNNTLIFPTEEPDRNYFRISAGISAVLKNGFSAFASYETVQGLRDISHHGVLLGLRKEF